jgi:hypothetical protein
MGRELDEPLNASSDGSLYECRFHLGLARVVPRHEERAVNAVQRLRQGLGVLEVRDDRLRAAGGEVDRLLLGPHHRARLGAAANEFFDERATDLAGGPGDEDGTQVSRIFHLCHALTYPRSMPQSSDLPRMRPLRECLKRNRGRQSRTLRRMKTRYPTYLTDAEWECT